MSHTSPSPADERELTPEEFTAMLEAELPQQFPELYQPRDRDHTEPASAR